MSLIRWNKCFKILSLHTTARILCSTVVCFYSMTNGSNLAVVKANEKCMYFPPFFSSSVQSDSVDFQNTRCFVVLALAYYVINNSC